MYLEHYDLNILPFENAPNPAFFYPSSMHKEALERLHYTVSQGKGAAMLVGGVGCGKTIISHALIEGERTSKHIQEMMKYASAEIGKGETEATIYKSVEVNIGSQCVIRDQLRMVREFQLADEIRAGLTKLGIVLEDTPQGTVWKRKR